MDQTENNQQTPPLFHLKYWGTTKGIVNIRDKVKFPPPILPYSMNALEPAMSSQCLKDHFYNYHMVHFENYLEKIVGTPAEKHAVDYVLHHSTNFSDDLLFELGGWLNHHLYWHSLSPHGGSMSPKLEKAIVENFNNFDNFKNELFNEALKLSCCGWVWLLKREDGSLTIITTEKNNNPMMGHDKKSITPLLVIDLWEHAYNNKFPNNKLAYLNSILMLINWTEVSNKYEQ